MSDPRVEEVDAHKKGDASDSDSDDAPELEAAQQGQAAGDDDTQVPKGRQTRSEKKSRKVMQKFGLKPFPGCTRVTIRKNKNVVFVIAQPDVYKSPQANTYVIFGEAKIEDTTSRREQEAVAALKQAAKPADKPAAKDDEDDAEGEVDEEGVDAKDIDLVVAQASVSRARAVKALKNNNGDIVNSIMELTM
eukprot:TRINITY_DN1471_c0_g1_i1.p1 TRINITY_DN1471_c0_g1~~TRINITY_DN1471_c0_g1_i1.p1  ORF type:complete len:191 (+),score=93.69 TRINITY_DN1471_c0_g1_i1:85-657(+)